MSGIIPVKIKYSPWTKCDPGMKLGYYVSALVFKYNWVPLNTTLTTKIKYENETEIIKIMFNINEHVLVKTEIL